MLYIVLFTYSSVRLLQYVNYFELIVSLIIITICLTPYCPSYLYWLCHGYGSLSLASQHPLTTDAWAGFRTKSCGTFGEGCSIKAHFSLSTLVLPCHSQSIIIFHLCSTNTMSA